MAKQPLSYLRGTELDAAVVCVNGLLNDEHVASTLGKTLATALRVYKQELDQEVEERTAIAKGSVTE
jgi:hypothetical protein